ncbi:MAG: nitrogen regulation protein NR(I) [Magnetovibrio sp.]|nr:nitrogen regulation protein NR(I) [Magnetovibrio sp.]
MSMQTILVADDDKAIRTVVGQALNRANFDVKMTSTASVLWGWVIKGEGNLIILDVMLPDQNGLDLIPRILEVRPELRVIVMSAENTLLTAVRANECGAFEYLPKPFDLLELIRVVRKGLDAKIDKSNWPRIETGEKLPLIGRSPAMQEIYRTLARVVKTELSILITGESGTGKELVARALHDLGNRNKKPFVAVNMASIPKELIESELFGHEKGAFTGAIKKSTGFFQEANGGTLFLDEIGDMPIEAQTRLLRVLQEGEFRPVGSNTPIDANVRIIAATHNDLKKLVRQGLFREDLFFRLNVVPVRLPPLRERSEDIPELVHHFLMQAVSEGLPWKIIEPEAINLLQQSTWPGNVRELENIIRRIAALYTHDTIGASEIEKELNEENKIETTQNNDENLTNMIEKHLVNHFQDYEATLPPPGLYFRMLEKLEKPLISITLKVTNGNQLRAANILGINRNTLRKKIRELGIVFIKETI